MQHKSAPVRTAQADATTRLQDATDFRQGFDRVSQMFNERMRKNGIEVGFRKG
jgi:hypothetical protein